MPMDRIRKVWLPLFVGCCLEMFFILSAFPQEGNITVEGGQEKFYTPQTVEFAGEMFNIKVPLQNYYFVKGVLIVFGNNFGVQPKTPREEEEIIWEQLMLSFEAFRRGIAVSQEEVNNEVGKILKAERVTFSWRDDPQAYKKWLDEKAGEPPELFENQMRHILQIQKLRQQIMDSARVKVSDKEAFEEFLNEHNSINLELVQFPQEKEAEEFYKKAKANKKFWEQEKQKRPGDFRLIGRVSLEFLIDLWKIPKQALYRMIKMRAGQIHRPEPVYEGYAVFKIIEKRQADKSEYYKDPKVKESCYSQIERSRRFEVLGEFYKKLKEEANISPYGAHLRLKP